MPGPRLHRLPRLERFRNPLLVLVGVLASVSWGTDLSELANGQHSFRQLGKSFYVEVPTKPAEGKLLLFNRREAERLHLDLPTGDALEKAVLSAFARVIDTQPSRNSLKMIATRYQDSKSKDPGDPLGDGRAVWSGEVVIPDAEGRPQYFDVMLKGVGQTPLAWTSHPHITHKDGFQGIGEAVHSFIASEAAFRNGIQTTVDLAVIQLPWTRSTLDGGQEQTALTVRVGKQTRLAHLRYFEDNPEEFKKLFDYVIRRDSQLPLDAPIGREEALKYLRRFASTLGTEAAYYYDLHAVHGSPTAGNRTTSGETIDHGTFRFLDAHHADYGYLYKTYVLGGPKGQSNQFRQYIPNIVSYIAKAQYPPLAGIPDLKDKLLNTFYSVFNSTQKKLMFDRLGLTSSQSKRLPDEFQESFLSTLVDMNDRFAHGVTRKGIDKKVSPAIFETRKILSEALGVYLLPPSERPAAWENVFDSQRSWARDGNVTTLSQDKNARQLKDQFIKKMDQLIRILKPSSDSLAAGVLKAKNLAANIRPEPGERFYFDYHENPDFNAVMAKINRGESFSAVNRAAEDAIGHLIDRGCVTASLQEKLSLGK